MPWYITVTITLGLFFLAPFYRKAVDTVLWPRIEDWWAQRSRIALSKKITNLEDELLQMNSEFEYFIGQCWTRLFQILWLGLFWIGLRMPSNYTPMVLSTIGGPLPSWIANVAYVLQLSLWAVIVLKLTNACIDSSSFGSRNFTALLEFRRKRISYRILELRRLASK